MTEDASKQEPKLLTWKDVKTWDDVVSPANKDLISKLEEENKGKPRCPCLRKQGNHFFYCNARANELTRSGCFDVFDMPSPISAQYQAAVDIRSLQSCCMRPETEYKECINFSETGATSG